MEKVRRRRVCEQGTPSLFLVGPVAFAYLQSRLICFWTLFYVWRSRWSLFVFCFAGHHTQYPTLTRNWRMISLTQGIKTCTSDIWWRPRKMPTEKQQDEKVIRPRTRAFPDSIRRWTNVHCIWALGNVLPTTRREGGPPSRPLPAGMFTQPAYYFSSHFHIIPLFLPFLLDWICSSEQWQSCTRPRKNRRPNPSWVINLKDTKPEVYDNNNNVDKDK